MNATTLIRTMVALLGLTPSFTAFGQGTAFSYQGRLNQNGAPSTGIYDLRLAIYAGLTSVNPVGGPTTLPAVPVSNGLFTVTLDFGSSVFTGPPRWIEIAVRTNGAPSFVTLDPRQMLTPIPYAIHASTASNVVDGSVVKSLNGLRDQITLSAGANVTISPNGNNLTLSAAGVGGTGLWSANNNNAYYTAGNVGIGTTQPQGLLDLVTGTTDLSALFVRGDPSSYGRGGIIHHQSATYGWQELAQATGSDADGYLTFHYVNRLSPATKVVSDVLTLRGNGNVGIGTASPIRKLTLFSSTYGFEHTDGSVRLGTYLDHQGGWLGTVSNHKLHFFVNDSFPKVTIDTAGNVGIGTREPSSKLQIDAQDALRIEGYQPFITMIDSSEFGLISPPIRYLQVTGDDLHVLHRPACNGFPCPSVVAHMSIKANGNVGIGTTTPQAKLDVIGTVRTSVLTITGGADIAEPFKMSSDQIPKGSVVIIDDQQAGNLKLSAEPYDRRVAGIVSGANGIRPGISLHQEGALDGGENVALSGRVYVLADATTDPIKPGDLLTTSATPGHAMKVIDHARAQGAILGKAMGSLADGKGMVLVLVTLQ